MPKKRRRQQPTGGLFASDAGLYGPKEGGLYSPNAGFYARSKPKGRKGKRRK